MRRVTIIGAGLSGLSAAIRLSEQNISCNLISAQPSERAQSVLAEGGFNAALDLMGEDDTADEHFNDTIKSGVFLADPNAVMGLTKAAPELAKWLISLGVPFQMEGGRLIQRNFGGQKKKRTSYAKSSTGKVIMTAVIDEARKYEKSGLIKRYPHHELVRLDINNDICNGAYIRDTWSDELMYCPGEVVLACGGLNGIFPGMTTGTTANTGNAASTAFFQGVEFNNLEFIQYHPTTVKINGKTLLISEAARGEGGKLCVIRNDRPWYFMEEKYPELGSLMPRDVVSKEIASLNEQVYLDLTKLSRDIWKRRLPDMREELIHYLGIDPEITPVPISPGIHFFMGGIGVDEHHRTNIKGLWAVGECACQYHGANRLGGNSLLGALYGGSCAAYDMADKAVNTGDISVVGTECEIKANPVFADELSRTLLKGLGIFRSKDVISEALNTLRSFNKEALNEIDKKRLALGEAMLLCAYERKESRGAHNRTDYPERNDTDFHKTTAVIYKDGNIRVSFRDIPKGRAS